MGLRELPEIPPEEIIAAGRYVVNEGRVSTAMLQRKFHWGFPKADEVVTLLYECGVIGPEREGKPRAVLVHPDDYEKHVRGM